MSACEEAIEDGGVPMQLRRFEVVSICQGDVPPPVHCGGEQKARVRVANYREVGMQSR